ncbi:MAG: UDP-2,3-diacylglucosamine diphosphatase [Saccharospirillum sp.]
MHLCASRPDISRAFEAFVTRVAPDYDALFILGDFFEYWVGDDAVTDYHRGIAEHLRHLSKVTSVFLMVGNRDFALGDAFAQRCGATLLPDPSLVTLAGQNWLLSHGDSLCTADIGYQRYRRVIRHPLVLGLLRRLPLKWRLALAERLRRNSRQRYQSGRSGLVDVTESAVIALLEQHSDSHLIHGHTHLADWHHHPTCHGVQHRLVLGDWHHYGWYLTLEPGQTHLLRFSIESLDFSGD